MTIADKIRSVLNIKAAIKAAIAAKGVSITDATPFSDYPSKIQGIVAADTSTGTAGYTVTATDVKLTKVVLPSTAKTIQGYAFSGYVNIKEIVVQAGTTKLDAYALQQTPNVEKITLPNTLTSIGTYALALNNQLLEITIPANVNLNNATYLLTNNTKLNKIDISACLLTTAIPQGFAESDTALTQVLLPSSVTTIGEGAFSGCTKLTNFDFSNITVVSGDAFKASGLTALNMPKATTISSGAFASAPIIYAILPKVTYIGNAGIYNSPLCKYIEIGSSLGGLGQAAISNLPKLEAIVIKATTPPNIQNDSFPNSGNYKIYVPDASMAAYKAVYNWLFFANRLAPMSEFVMPTL